MKTIVALAICWAFTICWAALLAAKRGDKMMETALRGGTSGRLETGSSSRRAFNTRRHALARWMAIQHTLS